MGKAAFMSTRAAAHELAKTMVDVGQGLGLSTTAMLTEVRKWALVVVEVTTYLLGARWTRRLA